MHRYSCYLTPFSLTSVCWRSPLHQICPANDGPTLPSAAYAGVAPQRRRPVCSRRATRVPYLLPCPTPPPTRLLQRPVPGPADCAALLPLLHRQLVQGTDQRLRHAEAAGAKEEGQYRPLLGLLSPLVRQNQQFRCFFYLVLAAVM